MEHRTQQEYTPENKRLNNPNSWRFRRWFPFSKGWLSGFYVSFPGRVCTWYIHGYTADCLTGWFTRTLIHSGDSCWKCRLPGLALIVGNYETPYCSYPVIQPTNISWNLLAQLSCLPQACRPLLRIWRIPCRVHKKRPKNCHWKKCPQK